MGKKNLILPNAEVNKRNLSPTQSNIPWVQIRRAPVENQEKYQRQEDKDLLNS
jgi:hypothetical protein